MSNLKLVRFLKRISQAKLGKEVGLNSAIISRLENDLYRNSPAVIRWKAKIAEVLDTPVESLFPDLRKDASHD